MQITSPPVVARGVVIVGSSIDDNQRVKEVSGAVRAYDARTGAAKWSWDPRRERPGDVVTGAANVWAPMSIDEARDLVILPTTSPSPDFWGGMRKGDDGDADSVVALNIETGRRSGRSRRCTTTSGTTTIRPSRRWAWSPGRGEASPPCCSRPSRGSCSRWTATPAGR